MFLQENLRYDIFTMPLVFITLSGEGGLIWFFVIGALLLKKSTRRLGILAVLSFVFCVGIAEFVKHAVMRPRPFADMVALVPLVERPISYSFPSVHTVSSFSVACMTLWAGKGRWRWGLLLFASLMAFSRLYVGVHYPSDVMAGIFIGATGSYVVYRLWKYRHGSK